MFKLYTFTIGIRQSQTIRSRLQLQSASLTSSFRVRFNSLPASHQYQMSTASATPGQPAIVSLQQTPISGSLDSSILSNEHRADLSQAEYFDVLDEEGRQTGEKKLRSEVHRDGDWHASVHIWILNDQTGKILLQKRAACKDSFPSCWDVSSAGHLAAGETVENATQAELAEELSITKPAHLTFQQFFHVLPTLKRTVISQGGKFIDREHTYIYYVEGHWDISKLTLQAEEVEAVEWMEIEDFIQQVQSETPGFVAITDMDGYRQAVFDPLIQRANEIKKLNGIKQ